MKRGGGLEARAPVLGEGGVRPGRGVRGLKWDIYIYIGTCIVRFIGPILANQTPAFKSILALHLATYLSIYLYHTHTG